MDIICSQVLLDKGSGVNEDIGFIKDKAAWVLDGSTGVSGHHGFLDYDSDAQWFTHSWNEYLKNNINRDQDLLDILKKGIEEIRELYFQNPRNSRTGKIDFPSSTLALVRWNRGVLEYFSLADSIVSIKKDKKVKTFIDDSVDKFDQKAYREMRKFIDENNGDIYSAREHISDLLIDNRRHKNIEGGYNVLEFDQKAIDRGVYGSVKGESFNILLGTDGFTAITDKYKRYELDQLVDLAEKYSLDHINRITREIEREDCLGKTYPRFKVHDDSSAIFLKLEK